MTRPITVRFLGDSSDLDRATQEVVSSMDKLGQGLATVGAAAGAAGGAAIGAGLVSSLNIESAQAKLTAQLGGTSQLSRDAGEVAGSLYAHAYGDSLDQVNEAVRSVIQSGAVMQDASKEQIESITAQAMSLSQAFGVDVAESMRAVGQMVRTGMAPDAEAGIDLIAVAFRELGPQAQDVLDTFTEYSTQFRKLGIDGPEALGMIQQMVKAGARDTDIAADALKEFSIRAVDGSKGAADAFKALGFDAQDMTAKFAQGGPAAEQAFAQVIARIKETQGQVDAATIAFGLFGTQSEDLGAALYAIDPSKAVAGLGQIADAGEKLDTTIGDTAQNKITGMQRSFEQWAASLVSTEGPIGTVAAATAAFGGQALAVVGPIGTMIAAQRAASAASSVAAVSQGAAASATSAGWIRSALASSAAFVTMAAGATASAARTAGAWALTTGAAAASAVASMVVTGASMVAQWTVMAAGAMARAAVMAASWFVAMGPVGWVIAAVVGLAALIIANWDTVTRWTDAAFDRVGEKISSAIQWAKGLVGEGVRFITDLFLNWTIVGIVIKHWDEIVAGVQRVAGNLVGFVASIPGRVIAALGNLGGALYGSGVALVSGFWDGLVARWNALMNWVHQAMANLRALWPFSPAKDGPFSGRGYVTYSGQALTGDFAESIRRGMPAVAAAVRGLMGAARGELAVPVTPMGAVAPAPASSGVAGTIRIQGDESGLSRFLLEMLRRAIKDQGGDVQKVLGR